MKKSCRKKKILIIEDEASLMKALIDKFNKIGVEILIARNGEEGLAVALADHPDLILLDIVMPRMDGITLLKILRKDKWGSKVPVILLTNLSDAEKIVEAKDRGVSDYLVKSDWRIEDVAEVVKKKLKIK